MTDPIRAPRFSTTGEQSGVQSGYPSAGVGGQSILDEDPINAAYVIRNLKPYDNLDKYASKSGLRKLRGMSYGAYERLAAKAVLQDAGVKRRKLTTKVNRRKFTLPVMQKAQQKTAQGYDIRVLGQRGADVQDIQNKRVRQATRHLIRVRRNRRIMSTDIFAKRGYDISMGHKSTRPVWQNY